MSDMFEPKNGEFSDHNFVCWMLFLINHKVTVEDAEDMINTLLKSKDNRKFKSFEEAKNRFK
jgi:hypothetical protein